MEKIIYLKGENFNWKGFKYTEISELEEILKEKNIRIGNRASIGNGVSIVNGIYLNGSNHPVTYCGNNKISISCENHTIEFWKENFESIGKSNGYSDAQILEYKKYIEIVEIFVKN